MWMLLSSPTITAQPVALSHRRTLPYHIPHDQRPTPSFLWETRQHAKVQKNFTTLSFRLFINSQLTLNHSASRHLIALSRSTDPIISFLTSWLVDRPGLTAVCMSLSLELDLTIIRMFSACIQLYSNNKFIYLVDTYLSLVPLVYNCSTLALLQSRRDVQAPE